MTVDRRSRRYLLGQDAEDERSALEERYFHEAAAAEEVAAAENELIDDSLADRLDAEDRAAFEHHYLATPEHRMRVATVQRLLAAANAEGTNARSTLRRDGTSRRTLALAASLLLVVSAAWYFAAGRTARPRDQITAGRPVEEPAAPRRSRSFAVSLAPVSVRGGDAAPPIVVPRGTDVLALTLEADGRLSDAPLSVTVKTVEGQEVWRGAAVLEPGGAGARADVPASRLQPDDYVIELAPGDAGTLRYVLRIGGE